MKTTTTTTTQSGKEEELIAEWSLGALFKLVDVEHIITLFKALLLEQKIILVCENLGVLSCIM